MGVMEEGRTGSCRTAGLRGRTGYGRSFLPLPLPRRRLPRGGVDGGSMNAAEPPWSTSFASQRQIMS